MPKRKKLKSKREEEREKGAKSAVPAQPQESSPALKAKRAKAKAKAGREGSGGEGNGKKKPAKAKNKRKGLGEGETGEVEKKKKKKKEKREKRKKVKTDQAKKKKSLLGEDDEGEGDDDSIEGFKINESFAKDFNAKQRSIEKLKEENRRARLMANLSSDEDSSSEEEEDENGMLLTPALDEQIHETLLKIKRKDPSIYERDSEFYKPENEDKAADASITKKKKEKKMTVNEYMFSQAKEDLDKGIDDDQDDSHRPRTQAEESAFLKRQFIETAKAQMEEEEGSDDDEEDDLFSKKKKSYAELQKEQVEFDSFLKEEQARAKKKILESMVEGRGAQAGENLSKDEKFLRDFVANEWWKETDASKLPSYEDIMGEEEPDQPEVDEDEAEIQKADDFEHKYNFRFQEKGSSEVITYPREVEDSVRIKVSKRKRQREAKKARRQAEMDAKAQEIRKLKKQKRKEIEEKLKEIREISGEVPLNLDLDEDFDPEKFDHAMQDAFNDDFYNKLEGDEDSLVHPEKELGDELIEQETTEFEKRLYLRKGAPCLAYYKADDQYYEAVVVKKLPKKRYRVKFRGYDDIVDLDIVELKVVKRANKGAGESAKELKKGMKCEAKYTDGKWYNAKILAVKGGKYEVQYEGYDETTEVDVKDLRPLAAGDREAKTKDNEVQKLLDEMYDLDYEDLIAGEIPCRFKYNKVEPADFGMTVKEILETDDKLLRQRVSMKHLAAYKNVKNVHWRRLNNSRPEYNRKGKKGRGGRGSGHGFKKGGRGGPGRGGVSKKKMGKPKGKKKES